MFCWHQVARQGFPRRPHITVVGWGISLQDVFVLHHSKLVADSLTQSICVAGHVSIVVVPDCVAATVDLGDYALRALGRGGELPPPMGGVGDLHWGTRYSLFILPSAIFQSLSFSPP